MSEKRNIFAECRETVEQIGKAIEAQGVPCPNDTPFRQYPEKIRSIGGKDVTALVKQALGIA